MRLRLLAACLLIGLAGMALAQADGERLRGQVEMAVLLSPDLQNADIEVSVDEGRSVQLGGSVGTEQSRGLAMDIARSIPGVESVSDSIELERVSGASLAGNAPIGETLRLWREAHIRTELNAEFESSPALETYDIDFSLEGNTLHLTGSVGTEIERTVASQLAQRLPEVDVVDNRLEVEETPDPAVSIDQEN